MIKAGIVGATGYAGAELYRLLLSHPEVEIAAVSSVSFEGKDIASVYPAYYKCGQAELVSEEAVVEKSDVVFASMPHGLSEKIAERCDEKGTLFIDLGADFRLESEEAYAKWYGCAYTLKGLHEKAVYGLPELNREKIKKAGIIGNPGCYPTSAALGLYPLLKEKLAETKDIVIDSKAGVTGAGRGLTQSTHYPECNEAFAPYKVGAHRHTPEIEETLTVMAGEEVQVTFVPHLLPVNRGIVSTMYLNKKAGAALQTIYDAYAGLYRNEPFVRIMPLGETANLKNVRLSNYCDISLHEDPHTGKVIVVSAIDNMVKGAGGQAIQNMNLARGLEETEGLMLVPPAF